jgi:hypothetical protein
MLRHNNHEDHEACPELAEGWKVASGCDTFVIFVPFVVENECLSGGMTKTYRRSSITTKLPWYHPP